MKTGEVECVKDAPIVGKVLSVACPHTVLRWWNFWSSLRSSAFLLRCCCLRCKRHARPPVGCSAATTSNNSDLAFTISSVPMADFPRAGGIRLWRLMGSITATPAGAHFCCRTSSSRLFTMPITGNMTFTIRSTKRWSKRSCQYSSARPRHAIPTSFVQARPPLDQSILTKARRSRSTAGLITWHPTASAQRQQVGV